MAPAGVQVFVALEPVDMRSRFERSTRTTSPSSPMSTPRTTRIRAPADLLHGHLRKRRLWSPHADPHKLLRANRRGNNAHRCSVPS